MTAVTAAPALDLTPARLADLTAALGEHAERHDRDASFPWEGLRAVHAAGLLTATAPGGPGLSGTDAVRAFQALGQGDPSVALVASQTVFLHAAQAADPVWPEGLYTEVLARSAERPVLLNSARAEPELGAPARGGLPATTVRRTAAGWVLDGRKAYVTGSEGLDVHLVWAVSDEPEPTIGHVVVPGDHPGVEVVRTWDHLGLRASSTHDVVYRGVEVPADHFRGVPVGSVPNNTGPRPGPGGALHLAVPALYLGVARAAQAFLTRFAHERVPTALGRPIATTERIQTVAGEVEAQLVQAEELLLGLAARIEAGDEEAVARAGVAKLLVGRAAIGAVHAAVAALGNPGLTRGNPLERHWRDVQCIRPHPPQDDAALLAAGRRALAR